MTPKLVVSNGGSGIPSILLQFSDAGSHCRHDYQWRYSLMSPGLGQIPLTLPVFDRVAF